jgi:hypothetical protein
MVTFDRINIQHRKFLTGSCDDNSISACQILFRSHKVNKSPPNLDWCIALGYDTSQSDRLVEVHVFVVPKVERCDLRQNWQFQK